MQTPIPCVLMPGRTWKALYFGVFGLPDGPGPLGLAYVERAEDLEK